MYEGGEGLWWWTDGEDSPIEYSLTDYYEEQLSQLLAEDITRGHPPQQPHLHHHNPAGPCT